VVLEPRPARHRGRSLRGRQHPGRHLRRRKSHSGNETDLAEGHGNVASQPVLALQIALPSSRESNKFLSLNTICAIYKSERIIFASLT
jgi:hypothetical protein